VEFGAYFKQFPQHKAWPFLADFASSARGPARGAAQEVELSPEIVRAQVLRTAVEVTGNKALAETAPLMEAGMDSLSAVEFRNRLSAELGLKLPNTLIFDYPTVAAVVELITAQVVKTAAPVSLAPRSFANEAVAVVGQACRMPNGNSPEEFWNALIAGRDSITRVPFARFDVEHHFSADRAAENKMYVRQGGFISGVERFDNQKFGISAAEAKTIDPQQRLLLEVAVEAFHGAGLAQSALNGTDTGVFVGLCNPDWAKLGYERDANPFTGPGTHASIASNRISYALGMKGPSLTVDTACSSSLVALDIAVQKLRRGECAKALAAGVNLLLSPEPFVAFSKAGMLSEDCRCKTFDASANGYVRGEGCGAVVLSTLAAAQEARLRILCVVRGTAVNQDGRSSSLTAPNGPSQQEVIRAALRDAEAVPSDVDCVECHGTGTALGDPIEVGALKAVFAPAREAASPVVLGALKSNIGHLESAAGIASVIKLSITMQRRTTPQNLHFKQLNPHIDV
jgi:acyl transferase domain-containing protein/acyl carrier protein